jgi:hypothetical protein
MRKHALTLDSNFTIAVPAFGIALYLPTLLKEIDSFASLP